MLWLAGWCSGQSRQRSRNLLMVALHDCLWFRIQSKRSQFTSTKHTQTSHKSVTSAALSTTIKITTAIARPNPRVAAEHTGCSRACRVKGRSPCARSHGQHLPVESRLLALVLLPNTESKSMLRPWGLSGCWGVGEPVNPGGTKTKNVSGGATTTKKNPTLHVRAHLINALRQLGAIGRGTEWHHKELFSTVTCSQSNLDGGGRSKRQKQCRVLLSSRFSTRQQAAPHYQKTSVERFASCGTFTQILTALQWGHSCWIRFQA